MATPLASGTQVLVRPVARILVAIIALILAPAASAQAQVSVTPKGAAVTRPALTSGNTVTFNVQNQEAWAEYISVSCSRTGNVASCSAPPGVNVPAGGSAGVLVTFTTAGAGSGTVRLYGESPVTGDEGWYDVTITAPAALVEVTPKTGSASASAQTSGNSVSFSVYNAGTASATFTLGCTRTNQVTSCNPSVGSVFLGAGDSTNVSVSYTTGSPGGGSVDLNASATGTSDSGSYYVTVTGSPNASVTPKGQSVTAAAQTSGNGATFTVQNTGTATGTFTISCSRTGQVSSCNPSSSSVTLQPDGFTVINVTYVTGTAGSGTLSLTAAAPGTTDTGSYNVTVAQPVASVTPKGQAATAPVQTSGNTASFTVGNTGGLGGTFNLSCGRTGQVSSCNVTSSSVTVGPGGSTNVTVTYVTGAIGSGTVSLTATPTTAGTSDTGSYNITVAGAVAEVTPKTGSTTAAAQTSGNTAAFTVRNSGTATATFNYQCGSSGNVTGCAPTSGSVQLGAGASTQVNATYSTGAGGTGGVSLNATAPGTSDAGTYGVSIFAGAVVTPKGTPVTKPAQTSGNTVSFTVQNQEAWTENISLLCSRTGSVTSCNVPASVSVPAGGSVPVTVTFATGPAGTGTVRLNGESPVMSDEGWYDVTAVAAVAEVTPKAGSTTAAAQTSGNTAAFTLRNNGTATATFSYQCGVSGNVTGCAPTSGSVQLVAGDSLQVNATYTAGAAGSGGVSLSATAPGTSDVGAYNVTIAGPAAPGVSPKGGNTAAPQNMTGRSAVFSVQNTGTAAGSFGLTCADDGAHAKDCSVTTSTGTLQPDGSQQVTVTYSTGSTGLGWIELKANGVNVGWYSVAVTSSTGSAPTIDVVSNTATIERQLCLNIALSGSSSVECGDLRVAHAFPATLTFNRIRQPVLTYNSQHAHPMPHLMVDVTVPTVPDSVRLVLTVGGVEKARRAWPGSQWTAGATRRVAIGYDARLDSTGVHPYQLEVTTQAGNRTTTHGELAFVNRSKSYFNGGWWLAGLERLYVQAGGLVWVGGDGSIRKYRQVATDVWVAPVAARSDTIRKEGTEYVRHLSGGTKIRFNAAGLHTATVPRLGTQHQTLFRHSSSKLVRIVLPKPAGPDSITYSFNYDGTLRGVTAPGDRHTQVTRTTYALTRFIYGDTVQFSYYSSANRMKTRRDRRGVVTAFVYDEQNKFLSDTVRMSPSPNIIRGVRSIESQVTSPIAKAPESVYMLFDGPRTDVGDTTRFYLDRYGAPARIKDALNDSTVLTPGDARFPALVTQIRNPNGFVEQATYTSRGNLATQTQVAPYGAGSADATTRYEYANLNWPDFVTRIVQPEGDVTEMGYDPVTGSPVWQQDGRGPTSRVNFRYYASGSGQGLLRATQLPGSSADSITYDARGNLRGTRTPLGFWSYTEKDEIGRDYLIDTPIDVAGTHRHRQWIFYDIMGRDTLTLSIVPAMNAPADTVRVRKSYDKESQLRTLARRAGPDINSIGWSTTEWTYDKAGRRVLEIHDGGASVDSLAYDPAGNVVLSKARNNNALFMQYDALNRLRRRIAGVDTARFTYSNTGQLTSATNRYARITRQYYPGGALKLDTLRIQESTLVPVDTLWTGYTTHVFGLRYSYDLNGRRTGLKHPGTVALSGTGVRDSVRYGYHPHHGSLAWVEGVGTSSRFDFGYNDATQLTTVYYPAAVTETRAYDADGRLRIRNVTGPAGGWWSGGLLRADTLNYDARDKITTASATWTGAHGIAHKVANINLYNGRGHLVGATHANSQYLSETWETDALGNQHQRSYFDPNLGGTIIGNSSYDAGTAQLRWVLPNDTIFAADTLTYWYDLGGNQTGTRHARRRTPNPYFPNGPEYLQNIVETNSYYDAEQRLVELRRLSTQQLGAGINKREYYRYDALGRRVWRRALNGWGTSGTVRDSLCTRPGPSSDCMSFVERTIWDGDQVLYEIRAGAEPGYPTALLESNNAPAPYFGRVVYTHGGGIDRPLEIVREGSIVTVPHTDWRGSYDMLTYTTPAEHASCGPSVGYPIGIECHPIDLLAVTAFLEFGHKHPDGTEMGPRSWWGNLLNSQLDASGLLYRRNRYYDPKQGRFTQEDPIGLAGGLNLYGYANGDPINFSDPFGLAPCPPDCGVSDAADLGASFVPGVSTVHDAAVLFGGRNLLTGESEGFGGRLAAGIGLITPAGGGQIRAAGKALSATGHFVHQAINRGVKPGAILDALRNPLRVNPVKMDELGRPSQSIVGRGATEVQNPETGALITTHPTSSRLRDRLLREQ